MPDAAQTEEPKLEPRSEIAEVGPCKLRLTIEVAADKVRARVEEKYRKLNETVALPGFRPGHAPRALLERKFGKDVLDEVKYELLKRSFEEVRETRGLQPLGEPDLDLEKIELKDGAPLAYEVTTEVRPSIALKAYTGVPVRRPVLAVGDEDLEKQLRELQEARAEWVPAEDGTTRADDQIVADFELRVDAKVIDSAENNAIELNADISFYGLQLEDYHKALCGQAVGATVEHPVRLPDSWPDRTYAGREAKIVCRVKSVKRRRLPEVTAEFAKAFDMDSVEELKEHWRKRLEREKEKEARSAMADQIVERLLAENEFPLPEGLVAAGVEEAKTRLRARLLLGGASEEEAVAEADKADAESRESVVRSIRERLLLEHIAAKEKIYVTEEQMDERVGHLASQSGKWPHELRAYLEEHGMMSALRRQIREEAVREFLLSKARIEEPAPKA